MNLQCGGITILLDSVEPTKQTRSRTHSYGEGSASEARQEMMV